MSDCDILPKRATKSHGLIYPRRNQKWMEDFKKMRLQRTKKAINKARVIKVKRIFAAISFEEIPI